MTDNQRISDLLIKKLNGELAAAEESELTEWTVLSEENRSIVEEFMNDEKLNAGIKEMYRVEAKIWGKLEEVVGVQEDRKVKRFDPIAIGWRRIAVAASVLLVIGFGSYLILKEKKDKEAPVAEVKDVKAPAGSKAVIRLSDGREVSIESLSSLTQSNVEVKKVDGKVIYTGEATTTIYNTLTNPRGSKVVNLILSDGTKVWLNSESSLTYPVSFTGNERKVEITGEAYFETAHLSPTFKVVANGLMIEDLGTEFNVNSYEGTRTTLVNGVVRIGSLVLKPGQQANNDKLSGTVDLHEVLAWKNNEFRFYSTSLADIVKELERWYDVNVEIKDNINDRFTGVISRNVNVSEVFRMLQQTGVLKVSIKNKNITITK